MCLDLNLPRPAIPPILIPDPSFVLTISFGEVGVSCCHFKLPAPVIPITIPIPPALLIPAITAMNALIARALPVLDTVHIPDCPLE